MKRQRCRVWFLRQDHRQDTCLVPSSKSTGRGLGCLRWRRRALEPPLRFSRTAVLWIHRCCCRVDTVCHRPRRAKRDACIGLGETVLAPGLFPCSCLCPCPYYENKKREIERRRKKRARETSGSIVEHAARQYQYQYLDKIGSSQAH